MCYYVEGSHSPYRPVKLVKQGTYTRPFHRLSEAKAFGRDFWSSNVFQVIHGKRINVQIKYGKVIIPFDEQGEINYDRRPT